MCLDICRGSGGQALREREEEGKRDVEEGEDGRVMERRRGRRGTTI